MNLEELQTARDRERQTDKLQQLRESFYTDAGEFIQQLRAERDRAAERADDPFDAPEVNRLTDEIDTAEQTVEAIYEKRVGKIVKAASFAAADLPAEADGMTAEEQELFDTLVADIKGNREQVMAALTGEDAGGAEPADPTADTSAAEPATDGTVSAADLMGSGDSSGAPVPPEPSDGGQSASSGPPKEPPTEPPGAGGESEPGETGPAESPTPAIEADQPPEPQPPSQDPVSGRRTGHGPESTTDRDPSGGEETAPHQGEAVRNDGGQPAVERRTVRVTDDIETFVGSDERDYDLQREDIVRLPEPNATLLIERDAAEQL